MGMLMGNKQQMSNKNNILSPVYEGSGAMVGTINNNLDVPFPSGIEENNILILQIGTNQPPGNAIDVPSGFTLMLQNYTGSMGYAMFWKRAAGTETGNLTVSKNDFITSHYGVMSRYSGCVETGTPYTDLTSISIASRSITTIAIPYNPLVISLGLAFFFQEDDIAWSVTSSVYTQAYLKTSTVDSDFTLALQSTDIIVGGDDPGDVSYSSGVADYTAAVGLLLTGG